jgi:hypothetical protein
MIGRIHDEAHIIIIFLRLMSVITLCDVTIQKVTTVIARIEKSTAYDEV